MSTKSTPKNLMPELRTDFDILVAEDSPSDLELVMAFLKHSVFTFLSVDYATSYKETKDKLARHHYDTLILDLGLPDDQGTVKIEKIRQAQKDLSIVVLTGYPDAEVELEVLRLGAQGYLSKDEMSARSLYKAVRESRQRKDVERVLRHALKKAKKRNRQLLKQAMHDSLTGLPNRSYFHEAGDRMLQQALRRNEEVAVLFIDINNFKKINDTYGHTIGDETLRRTAEIFKDHVREDDFLARIGGDEFSIIVSIKSSRNEIRSLTDRILRVLRLPLDIAGRQIHVQVSLGISFYPDADNMDLLLRNADSAMYAGKTRLESSVRYFDTDTEQEMLRASKLEQKIGIAARESAFSVAFQPIVSFNNAVISAEALIRCKSKDLEAIRPEELISIAENTPAIDDITRTVIRESAKLSRALVMEGLSLNTITINVCASQVQRVDFCSWFIQCLKAEGLSPKQVSLELTERQLVTAQATCIRELTKMRYLGMKVILDDYGTGFSSLTHLLSMKIDALKIDRSLIANIDTNTKHRALTKAVIDMAHTLDVSVVAEGVECRDELDTTKALEIDSVQGYFISPPLTQEDFLKFYHSWRKGFETYQATPMVNPEGAYILRH